MPRVVIDPAVPDRGSLDNEIARLRIRCGNRKLLVVCASDGLAGSRHRTRLQQRGGWCSTVGLKPIRQNAEQEMAGQVRVRPPPDDVMPTASKLADVETAQVRNLDVDCLAVRQGRA